MWCKSEGREASDEAVNTDDGRERFDDRGKGGGKVVGVSTKARRRGKTKDGIANEWV